jgi:hypothetical protein
MHAVPQKKAGDFLYRLGKGFFPRNDLDWPDNATVLPGPNEHLHQGLEL